MHRLKRHVAATLAALTLLLVGVVPAGAIVGGEPDGTRHPNVGTLVAEFGRPTTTRRLCSGSLIANNLFLTAAHCLPGNLPPEYGAVRLVGVSFNPAFVLGQSTLVPIAGAVGHRDFDWNDFASPDIAVVRLAQPASAAYPGIEPVALPGLGTLDAVMAEPGWRRQQVTPVGYGTTGVTHGGGPPQGVSPGVRKYAVAWLRQGPDPTHLSTTSHPGGPNGDGGGQCSGDSGGSVFLGDPESNLQLGIISSSWMVGPDYVLCRSPQNAAFRLDTAVAQAFLCDFGVVACPNEGTRAARAGRAGDAPVGGKGARQAHNHGRD